MMDAKTTILKGIESWNAHDREGFLGFYGESFTFVDEPTGQQLSGRDEFGKGFYDLWTDAYPDNEIKDPVVFGEGARVCMQARFVGTNTGSFTVPGGAVPPTGKQIDAPFVFITEVHDGKVTRAWHYYDRLLAFEQEGILSVEKLIAQLQAA